MESFERLATIGLLANFTVFLMTVFHMTQVSSSYLIYIWSGIGNFAPLIGAYISDAHIGKFWVIAFASFASLIVRFDPSCSQFYIHAWQFCLFTNVV